MLSAQGSVKVLAQKAPDIKKEKIKERKTQILTASKSSPKKRLPQNLKSHTK
jgi:hypothetical protein